jgi:hypothetical protein
VDTGEEDCAGVALFGPEEAPLDRFIAAADCYIDPKNGPIDDEILNFSGCDQSLVPLQKKVEVRVSKQSKKTAMDKRNCFAPKLESNRIEKVLGEHLPRILY